MPSAPFEFLSGKSSEEMHCLFDANFVVRETVAAQGWIPTGCVAINPGLLGTSFPPWLTSGCVSHRAWRREMLSFLLLMGLELGLDS